MPILFGSKVADTSARKKIAFWTCAFVQCCPR
jgi:hypothetical protein